MGTLRARVANGRVILDEPTDLPEGTEVELHLVDAPQEPSPDLSDAEFAELKASVDCSRQQFCDGDFTAAKDVQAWLRRRS